MKITRKQERPNRTAGLKVAAAKGEAERGIFAVVADPADAGNGISTEYLWSRYSIAPEMLIAF